MSWAKFDDRYDDHPKVNAAMDANPLAALLHVHAITASARYELDGIVDPRWLKARVPNANRRKAAVTVLVEKRLFDVLRAGETVETEDTSGNTVTIGPFDENRLLVHDFLEYNRSSAQAQAKRAADAERLRKKRGASPRRSTNGSSGSGKPKRGDSRTRHAGDSAASREGVAGESQPPDPTRPRTTTTTALSPGKPGDPVRMVFDEWVRVRVETPVLGQRPAAASSFVLSKKRRRYIKIALDAYPLADVLDAVRGWRHSSHHRGENDRKTAYNNIELLLRDSEQIEKFRDFERAAPATADVVDLDEKRRAALAAEDQ